MIKIITERERYFSQVADGLFPIEQNGKWGFIDKNFNVIIPAKYDKAFPFLGELTLVFLDKKCGYIDKKGNEVIPLRYDDGEAYFYQDSAEVTLNGKCGLINRNGYEVIPIKYDKIERDENIVCVHLNGKCGIIDKNTSQEIIPPIKYDNISYSKRLTAAQLNGKWALIDKFGKELTQFRYDHIRPFNQYELAVVELNSKYGVINQDGKEIFPIIYDRIERDFNEVDGLVRAVVSLNGKDICINKDGGREILYYKFESESRFISANNALKNAFGVNYSQFIHGGSPDYGSTYFMRIYDNCNNLQLADRICIENGCSKSWHNQNGDLIQR